MCLAAESIALQNLDLPQDSLSSAGVSDSGRRSWEAESSLHGLSSPVPM